MTDFFLGILIIVTIALGLVAFLKHPLNFGFIVGALNSLFVLFPMFIYVNFRPAFLEYSMTALQYTNGVFPFQSSQFLIALTSLAWLLGGLWAQHVAFLPERGPVEQQHSARRFSWFGALLVVGCCLVLFLAVVRKGDFSLLELVSPSRKRIEDVYGSYWVSGALIYMPAMVAMLRLAFRRKLELISLAIFSFSLLVAFGTGQRRTIILLILMLFFTWLTAKVGGEVDPDSPGPEESRLRRPILVSLGGLSLLGPVLWAARSYFTQLFSDQALRVTNPFAMRGFLELFFGSTATGFIASVLSHEIWRSEQFYPAYSYIFLAVSPVPRAFWAAKPISPDGILENYFYLPMSPSLFMVADAIFNFYFFAPFAALMMAYLFTRLGTHLWQRATMPLSGRSSSCFSIVLFALFSSRAIVLFKNGVSAFLISVFSGLLFLALVHWLVMPRRYR